MDFDFFEYQVDVFDWFALGQEFALLIAVLIDNDEQVTWEVLVQSRC